MSFSVTVPHFCIIGGILGHSAPEIRDGRALNVNDYAEMSIAEVGGLNYGLGEGGRKKS
jgi:hypothetical protein